MSGAQFQPLLRACEKVDCLRGLMVKTPPSDPSWHLILSGTIQDLGGNASSNLAAGMLLRLILRLCLIGGKSRHVERLSFCIALVSTLLQRAPFRYQL